MPRSNAAQVAAQVEAQLLFGEKGYFASKASEIAGLARVAPATVFAVIAAEMLDRIAQMDDPAAIVALAGQVCWRMREEFGDMMRAMLAAAPHDPNIAEIKAVATAQYRAAFVPVAQRLADLGALRDGMDVPQAIDVFWFTFGYAGLFALHDDNGWSFARTEQGLYEAASRALLRRQPNSTVITGPAP